MQAYIKTRVTLMGLDTSHFQGKGWGKGLHSPNKQRLAPAQILQRQPPGKMRTRRSQLLRALIEIGVPYQCAECSQGPEWNKKPLDIQIDHIDGDSLNNQRENLQFLCPNCHTQTPTYGNKARV